MVEKTKTEDINIEEIIADEDKGYFAAKDADKCVDILFDKIDNYYNTLRSIGYTDKLLDMYAAWHGTRGGSMDEAHVINFGGEDGELTEIVVNHLRNIGSHMLSMTTSTRPSLETRAVNTDYKSQVQTKLGDALLDYYMRELKLEKFLKQACEYAIVFGSGWVKLGWNARRGRTINQEEISKANREKMAKVKGTKIPLPEYEGDIQFENLSPFDIIEDLSKENDVHDWRIARSFKNRFDLIATYPEFSDSILNVDNKEEYSKQYLNISTSPDQQTDDIPIFEFFHERTEALPNGRYILFIDRDSVLYDGPLPYRKIPLFSMKPDKILGTPLGYTILFDLLPIQAASDMLYSTILSNQAANGIQNILLPTGANIEPSQIAGGLNIIRYNIQHGEPKAMQLTKTAPEIFDFLNMLIQAQETISGINSVVRGNPEANLRSGSAIAMIESNAIQYMSGIQSEYVHLVEDVGLSLLEMLIDFAHSPRIASIVGKSQMSYTETFKGEDLSEISRVIVDVSNPLTKTVAGRVNMADNLLQYGEITPDQYINVIKTGNLDVATDGIVHEQMNIQRENEYMLMGKMPRTVGIDQHLEHIKGHRGVIADPFIRENDELVGIVLGHIQEHIDLLKEFDPETLMSIGEQPLQSQQAAPPAGGGGAPGEMNPAEGPASLAPTSMPAEEMAMEAQGAQPNNIRMPEGFSEKPLSMEENLAKNNGIE